MDADAGQEHSLTEYVASFGATLDYDDIPDSVMRLGMKAILDSMGVALSGSVAAPSKIVRDYLQSLACEKADACVIGAALRLPPRFAALANGTAMHADDYDDTLQAETGRYGGIHPSSPVLAALLAVAEQRGIGGRELLVAFHAGVEIACRVFDATHVNHILHGFHTSSTCAMLGAAAGVARLSRLATEPTRIVLGLAATMSGGLMQNFGTMAKPFHSGRAAECAIVAVDLVQLGFTASNAILETPRGFFSALGGGCEEGRLRGKLGKPWSFVDRGIWLKPFPTGSLAHPAMTGLLQLLNGHDIKPKQVAKINVKTSQHIHETLLHHRPKSELEAKFSMEFCMAVLLLEHKCGLSHFSDEYVNRPDVQRAIALVDYRGFDEVESRNRDYNIVTSFIEVVLTDGRRFSVRADHGKGNIVDPMSEGEVAAKFRDCAQYARWPAAKTERAIDLILHLDQLSDVRELIACVSA